MSKELSALLILLAIGVVMLAIAIAVKTYQQYEKARLEKKAMQKSLDELRKSIRANLTCYKQRYVGAEKLLKKFNESYPEISVSTQNDIRKELPKSATDLEMYYSFLPEKISANRISNELTLGKAKDLDEKTTLLMEAILKAWHKLQLQMEELSTVKS